MLRNAISRRGAWLTAPLVVMLFASIAACGGGGDKPQMSGSGQALVLGGEDIASADLLNAARTEGKLTIYSAVSEEPEMALLKDFTKKTGIKTSWSACRRTA